MVGETPGIVQTEQGPERGREREEAKSGTRRLKDQEIGIAKMAGLYRVEQLGE